MKAITLKRLGFEMDKRNYEIWNICTNEKTCRVLKNALTSFGPI